MLDDELFFEQMCDEYKDVLESWFSDDAEKEYEEMLNELDVEEYYPYCEWRVQLWLVLEHWQKNYCNSQSRQEKTSQGVSSDNSKCHWL